MGASEVLRHLVDGNLSLYQYENANFYAERLYYEDPSPQNLNLLAKCFFQQGKMKQTYLLLIESDDKSNRYLLALACIALKKYTEAEKALLPEFYSMDPKNMSKHDLLNVPGGAAGLYLLGIICRREHRKDSAIIYFEYSLQIDPTSWSSICELSEMGVDIDLCSMLHMSDEMAQEVRSKLKSFTTKSTTTNSSNKKKSSRSNQSNTLANRMTNESFNQDGMNSPRALSLGLSSLAMRVPFASPGPIDSSHSRIDMNPSFSFNNSTSNIQQSHHESQQHGQQPRALFEMSSSTITPFMKSFNLNEGSARYPSSMLPPKSEIMPRNRFAKAGMNSAIPSDYNQYHSSSSSAISMNDNSRRVSLGPTARLSFSGAADLDTDMRNNTLLGQSTNNLENNIDDEYPQKVHRIGHMPTFKESPVQQQQHHGFEDNSLMMSPIANSTDTPNPNNVSSYAITDQSKMRGISLIDTPHSQISTTGPPRTAININTNDKINNNNKPNGSKNIPENDNKLDNDAINPEEINTKSWSDFYNLILLFASAYQSVNLYKCQDCISILKLLPKNHFFSGYVYQMIGKAYYEMCDYKSALLSLKEMLRLEPFRVKGTEVLSSVLWHLKKEKDLCALAQQVIELDKFAPEPWCVVGNCFSLQREPDVAIRYFQRALQIDNTFTYAHTLYGHELVSNEDLEKAMKCFRTAILYDERHYNAWYGLGTIYYRQEKYELAEYHFRKALSINNASSVLKCFLGMVLQAQGSLQDSGSFPNEEDFLKNRDNKLKEALKILTEAIIVDSKNPQLRFQRAHVLSVILNYLEADGGDVVMNKSSSNVTTLDGKTYNEVLREILEELLVVKELAPREPPVYVMLAQTYQKLGRTLDAIRNYNLAIDLDPKDCTGIKAILEAM